MRAPALADLLRSAPMTWHTEAELQAELARVLSDAGVSHAREVHLEDGLGRIDLLAGRVGVEVKVGSTSTWADVVRQLTRYAASDHLDELVLVTTTARHRLVPGVVGGKPVRIVFLLEAGL